MSKIYTLADISKISFPIKKPSIIFLKGDLGSGKTTLVKHILNNILSVEQDITSPTYTYYNKYISIYGQEDITIYHFDLYRISHYDEFFAIGGEDILENNTGLILIEWPEIIEPYYSPDIDITISKTNNDQERKIDIYT